MENIYNSTEKRVFLTYDDGPSANVTPVILDTLKNQNGIFAMSNDDFDLDYTKYLISDRRKTKAIVIRPRARGKAINQKTTYKNPYFPP